MRLSNIYKIMLDLKYVDPIETSRDIMFIVQQKLLDKI